MDDFGQTFVSMVDTTITSQNAARFFIGTVRPDFRTVVFETEAGLQMVDTSEMVAINLPGDYFVPTKSRDVLIFAGRTLLVCAYRNKYSIFGPLYDLTKFGARL